MLWLNEQILTLMVASLTLLVGVVVGIRKLIRQMKLLVSERPVIVAILDEIPEPLQIFKDYTSYLRALSSNDSLVLLHCKRLSFALRKCDFVVAEERGDIKIKGKESSFWKQLAEDYTIREK